MHTNRFGSLALASVVFALLAASCGSNADDAATTSAPAAISESTAADDGAVDGGSPAGAVVSPVSGGIDQSFDLVWSDVTIEGQDVVFTSQVVAAAGESVPDAVGDLDGAPVWSYVWPTSLDSSAVGFDVEQGILALAATAHPDFDDTPLYDENGDGDKANDGALWHAHWVVLVEDAACGGGLTVRDIPEGETPLLPATWPELPILIDSPDITPTFDDTSIEIRVPANDIGAPTGFSFDGVTSGLRVSTTPGDPLLCIDAVFDIASGDLSLPGMFES